jgi:arylformamidase
LKSKYVFLSYPLEPNTPSYGAKERFEIERISNIELGASSNHSKISTSVHLGTHIDFPAHFFEQGLCAEKYDADFFIFSKPLLIEITPNGKVILSEVIGELENVTDEGYDILLVKTGGENQRSSNAYMFENYGFAPFIADFLRLKFPSIRVMGFDTISVSSFTDRMTGREAHKAFLGSAKPILLLEDMSFAALGGYKLKNVIVSPTRVIGSDGALCTVFGEIV